MVTVTQEEEDMKISVKRLNVILAVREEKATNFQSRNALKCYKDC